MSDNPQQSSGDEAGDDSAAGADSTGDTTNGGLAATHGKHDGEGGDGARRAGADVDRPHWVVPGLGLVAVVFVAVSGLARAFGFQSGALYIAVTVLGAAVAATIGVLEATSDRPTMQRLVAIGAVFATTALLISVFWIFRPPPAAPEEMAGDLNIAVAEFGAATDDEELERTARTLSSSLTTFLESEAETFRDENTLVEIRGPDEISPIDGENRVERAESARELAEEINADVVLYGVLTTDGAQTALEPEFVLNDRRLGGALELTGHHTLGTPVTATGAPIDAARSLRTDARARVVALARFMVGLTFYRIDQHETARDYFERARDDPAWRDEDGKELVYLFLGNVEGKLRNFDDADQQYATALGLNPQFARAMVGQAELDYLRSFAGDDPERDVCTPDAIDPEGLDAAIDRYGDAAAASDQPAISDVDLKASYGIARVELCKYLAGDRDVADAVAAGFRAVIDGFASGRESVQALASEAYGNLAVLASTNPSGSADSVAVACEVVGLYERAIETSQSTTRRVLFESNMEPARTVIEDAGETCPEAEQ